jgi:hypothetical protein
VNQMEKTFRSIHSSQGVDPRHARTRHEFRVAGYLLLFAFSLTLLGVYTVWLKMQIDCKYLRLDEIKKQNLQLDTRIKKLEAEVGTMMSYQRVERVLKEAGYEMYVPDEALYLRLDDSQESMMKAEGVAPRPDGTVY